MTNPPKQPLVYETHSHTHLCGHAEGTLPQYADHAVTRNLKGLIVTCHNPMPDNDPDFGGDRIRMRLHTIPQYLDLIQSAAEKYAPSLQILPGLECDYFPGYESFLQTQLDALPLHHVLGSIHPQLPKWRAQFFSDDPLQTQTTYFNQLADAAETKLFDTIAHPDLIKNHTRHHWNPVALLDTIKHTLDRIAKTGVAMELNTSGLNKPVAEMNPFPVMLREMQIRNIPIVLGADAHTPKRVSANFEQAYTLLQQVGYTHTTHFINRTPTQTPIPHALASLTQSTFV